MHNKKRRFAYLAAAVSLSGAIAGGMPVSALAGQTGSTVQEKAKAAVREKPSSAAASAGKTADLSAAAEGRNGNAALQVTAGNFYDASDVTGQAMSRQEKKIWKNWIIARKTVYVVDNKKDRRAIGTLERGAGALILDEDKTGYEIKAGRRIGWVKKSKKLMTGQKAYNWMKVHSAVKAETSEAGTSFYTAPDAKSESHSGIQKVKAVVENLDNVDLLTPDLSDYTTSAAWVGMNIQGKTMYAKSSDVVTGYDISGISPIKGGADTPVQADGTAETAKDSDENTLAASREQVFSISLTGKCAADVYSYMGWRCITSRGSVQYKLLSQFESYDKNGFGKIGDRYVIATTTTFGEIGDLVDFTLANGQVIHAIIGDHKNMSDPGCNMWGHQKGHCVVEFVVNKASWYGTSRTPTGFHSEWASRAVKATNYGNIWDDDHTDYAAKAQKALAHIRALEANGGDKPTPTEEEQKEKKEAEAKKKAKEKKAKEEKLKKAKAKKKKARAEKLRKEKAEKRAAAEKARKEKLEKEEAEKLKRQQEEEARKKAEEQKQKEAEEKKQEEEKKSSENTNTEKKENSGSEENGNQNSSADENTAGDSSAPAEE